MPATMRRAEPIATIAFDRRKYGALLDADANEVAGLAHYIVEPRAHRLRFYELVLMREDAGEVELDGRRFGLPARRVVCTRPGEVRRWHLIGVPSGLVVCFAGELFDGFFADAGFVDRLPFFAVAPRMPLVDLAPAAFARAEALALAMHGELARRRDDSQHMLRAGLYQLLIELARAAAAPAVPASSPQRAHPLAQRFRMLLERQFRRDSQVQAYAHSLGVTAGHLNACVREAFGASAGALIRERRLLEACRMLRYGDEPVLAVARALGFRDASYFNRFFKRATGRTPLAYRESIDEYQSSREN